MVRVSQFIPLAARVEMQKAILRSEMSTLNWPASCKLSDLTGAGFRGSVLNPALRYGPVHPTGPLPFIDSPLFLPPNLHECPVGVESPPHGGGNLTKSLP